MLDPFKHNRSIGDRYEPPEHSRTREDSRLHGRGKFHVWTLEELAALAEPASSRLIPVNPA